MELAYVIERHINSELRYWGGRRTDDAGFVVDHSEAIRFARRDDGAIVLSWLLGGCGNVTQHGWERTS